MARDWTHMTFHYRSRHSTYWALNRLYQKINIQWEKFATKLHQDLYVCETVDHYGNPALFPGTSTFSRIKWRWIDVILIVIRHFHGKLQYRRHKGPLYIVAANVYHCHPHRAAANVRLNFTDLAFYGTNTTHLCSYVAMWASMQQRVSKS